MFFRQIIYGLIYRMYQFFRLYRFKKVISSIQLESMKCIFVVSGNKNDLLLIDLQLFKKGEGIHIA